MKTTTTTATPPAALFDPDWFDKRIASIDEAITAKNREIAAETLKLVDYPNDEKVHREAHRVIAVVKTEIAEQQLQRETLVQGRALAAARDTQAERAAFIASLEAEGRRVEEQGDELVALVEKVLDHIEPLGALLAQIDELSTQRSLHAYGIFRAARDRSGVRKAPASVRRHAVWDGYKGYADMRRGPISEAITTALWRCGIGRVGPEVRVTVDAPSRGRVGWNETNRPVRELMRQELTAGQQRLAIGIRQALATVAEALKEQSK